ncbi:MAG: sulfatase-like hydrolase/transferase, partial [Armatimonadota bacterium]|nr:sulfatase-like hydrolase/transferase [Armatimonadota bacterium]
ARGMKQWLDPDAPTLARTLQAAGYATGHFGKWHMGGQRDVGDAPLITEYGFDASLTQFEGLGDRILPMLDDRDGKPPRKMPLGVGSEKLGRGKITWLDRARVTTAFVDRAIQFIHDAQKSGKPFYVNVWPDDVHSPFFPTAVNRGDGTKKALYEGVVHETDAQLAPLFDLIRTDPALRDNTFVLVASDNGPEPGAGSPGPFRGHKGNLYEGGIREPLIAWGPGLVKTPGINEKTVINGVDVLPSLLAITGVAPTPADKAGDGEDLSAALLGHRQPTRTKPLFWIRPPDRPGPADHPKVRWPDLAVREGDWKLCLWEDGTHPQLYNLATD